MVYDFRMLDGIPTYEIDLSMSQWQPKYPQLTIVANGLEGQDIELFIDGLDTTMPRNVEVNVLFSTQENLTVPRVSVDMHYDAGVRLKSAHAILIDHQALTRVEALVVGIPQSTDVSAVIGDVLILDLVVPEEYRINGHSADSLFTIFLISSTVISGLACTPSTSLLFCAAIPSHILRQNCRG
mgnify:CR=1 FL=1